MAWYRRNEDFGAVRPAEATTNGTGTTVAGCYRTGRLRRKLGPMKPPFRLPLTVALALALLVPAIGMAVADEAAQPAAEAAAASTAPEPQATEADSDCGCGARSPAQLLETQRELEEAVSADPGS